MRLRYLLLSLYAVTTAALIVDVALIVSIREAQQRVDQATQYRKTVQALLEEVAEGTELLASLLHHHAVTGQRRHLDEYNGILAVWRGERPPTATDGWRRHRRDSMATGDPLADGLGDATVWRSLPERLASLELTQRERGLATTVLEESENLERQVAHALVAAKPLQEFAGAGEPSVNATQGRGALVALLASPEYELLQVRRSGIIEQLSASVNSRAEAEVGAAQRVVERRWMASLSANALLLILVALAFVVLRRHLMTPIQAVVTEPGAVTCRNLARRPETLVQEPQFVELASLASTLNRMSAALRQVAVERDGSLQGVAQVRSQADAAGSATSSILAHLSHEIRTPMNAVLGMTTLALRTDLSATARNYLDKSMQASRHLLRVIDDILDHSKIEAGAMSVESLPFCIEETVSTAIGLVRDRAEAKGLELLCDFEDTSMVGGMTIFYGDALRLQQVLTNLLSNAVKFTDSGQVSVSVAAEPMEHESPGLFCVTISVRDTGIGMTAQQCARLFQAFSQADASISRRYGGSGLGLAISQGLMQLMGGNLVVSSEPHGGSCFTLRLSLPRAPGGNLQDPVTGHRLLLVGGSNAMSGSLLTLFDRIGMRADIDYLWTPDPAAALASLRQYQASGLPCSLLLSDEQLPEAAMRRFVSQLESTWPTLRVGVMAREDSAGLRELMNRSGHTVFDIPLMPKDLRRFLAAAPVPQRLSGAHAAPSPAIGLRLAGMRVLLVEDDPLSQEVALGLLALQGVRLSIASNGQEAIEMLMAGKRRSVDLVLMDMQMPLLDGLGTVRRLRADRQWDHLPIIAMTGETMPGDRERFLAAGMQDYLPKPLMPAQLYETLARWCSHAAKATAVPTAGLRGAAIVRPAGALPHVAGLDMSRLLVQCAGDEALAWRLMQAFVREYAKRRPNAVDWLDARDIQTLRRQAHTLRTLGGTLACDALQRTWQLVEEAAATGNVAAVEARLPLAQRVLTDLVDDLTQACELQLELGGEELRSS